MILCRRTQGVRPKVGDVILFEHGSGWQLKRIAAVAGDSVALSQKAAEKDPVPTDTFLRVT